MTREQNAEGTLDRKTQQARLLTDSCHTSHCVNSPSSRTKHGLDLTKRLLSSRICGLQKLSPSGAVSQCSENVALHLAIALHLSLALLLAIAVMIRSS